MTNTTSNPRHTQVMQAAATWLAANPQLPPISRISLTDTGEIHLMPAGLGAGGYAETRVRGLYALAEAVGAEVTFGPDPFNPSGVRGWALVARWQMGEWQGLPILGMARLWLRDAAVGVRPVDDQDAPTVPAIPDKSPGVAAREPALIAS